MEGYSWKIRYGDGSSAGGQVYSDKVSIGNITVPNQAVEAATTVSGQFTRDVNMDGLLGLGLSKLNTIKPKAQLTWFDNIKPKLAAPVFTSALKRRQPGTYDFGFIDKAKYRGNITYVNVNSKRGFWDFQITGFAVGSSAVQTPQDGPINAIADTGCVSSYYVF
jgi:aspergillopepsin I